VRRRRWGRPLNRFELKVRSLQANALGCFLINLFPNPNGSTTWFRAFVCRWFHRGVRCSSGLPSASHLLTHDIRCQKCGATYEIVRPNNPQYSTKMPFQSPDRTQPKTWDDWHRERGEA